MGAGNAWGILVLGWLLGIVSEAAPVAPPAERDYILAVHPYLPAARIRERFSPLAQQLSVVLERPVRVRVGVSYDQHIQAIGRDRVDLAFLGPAGYVRVTGRFGRKPLLAGFEVGGESVLHGVIAVRAQDPARRLGDLVGRYLAFGDPQSTMSHLVPRYLLRQAGVELSDLAGYRFLGAHDNVALALLAGDFDAGALKREVFTAYAGQGLRVLAQSPAVPEHLFVARSDLPAPQLAVLRDTLLGLHDSPRGRALLTRLRVGLTRLVPVRDGDYDGLRAMLRSLPPAGEPP